MSETETKPAPAPNPEAAPAPVAANPQPALTKEEVETLHRVFAKHGGKRLGELLDRLCTNPDCELAEED